MKNSQRILIGLMLIGLTNIYVDCGRRYNNVQPLAHYYNQSIDLTPYQLNYAIGDTVWMHLLIPDKTLYDTITKQHMVYDSASFATYLQVQLLYNNPFVANGSPLASFVYMPGLSASEQTYQYVTNSQLSFGCNQVRNYEVLVGIVFKEKGVFGISLSGTIQKCNSNVYTYSGIGFYFNVDDAHYNFYTQLPFADIGQQTNIYVASALLNKTTVCINVQ